MKGGSCGSEVGEKDHLDKKKKIKDPLDCIEPVSGPTHC